MNCISNASQIVTDVVVYDAYNNVIASAPSGTWRRVTLWMKPYDDYLIDSGEVVWTLELRPGITGDANTLREAQANTPRRLFTVQYDLHGEIIQKELLLIGTGVNTLTGALVFLEFELPA